jgi:hypothetical protein
LHVISQHFIGCQLGWFGTAQRTISMPLRSAGPLFQSAAARRSIAAQLAGDRRRRSPKLAGDGPNAVLLDSQDGDFFALGKR